MSLYAQGNAENGITRRGFLALGTASLVSAAAGCATNPVSGRRQFMLVSEGEEIRMDRRWSPHQISSDGGAFQDDALNAYVTGVGLGLASCTQRPHMPYSFRVVNSPVVNGYTMPAGTVALARGLMLELNDEAELAAVLGHELGHVNARHAGERMSKTLLAQALVVGASAYLGGKDGEYSELAAGLGGIGSAILLSRYSRNDEREADALGMDYVSRSGLSPAGMGGVMQTFMKLHKEKPSSVELLFATHPLSSERYETALGAMRTRYAGAASLPARRERYMDQTARLRTMRDAIVQMQNGDEAMEARRYADAEKSYGAALRQVPSDYGALLSMAKCCLAQNKADMAQQNARRAREAYPSEPQAVHVLGMALLKARQYDPALSEFSRYRSLLPGNPNTLFFTGYCHEGAGRRGDAAQQYTQYLAEAPNGDYATHARRRLTEWSAPKE